MRAPVSFEATLMSLGSAAALPIFVTCAHCGDRRYDEPNRRHITARVGGRTVCADLIVNDVTTTADDAAAMLNTAARRLLSAPADSLVEFEAAS